MQPKTARQQLINRIELGLLPMSFSKINNFMESPSHFISYCIQEHKTTDAMLFGTLCHSMILEPEKFDDQWLVMRDVALNTLEGKKEFAYCCSIACGRKIIKDSVYRAALKCKATVLNNVPAYDLLMQCTETEKKINWRQFNYDWTGYIDANGPDIIVDLKKVADASPSAVRRGALKSGWHRQAYLYLIGSEAMFKKKYYIIAFDESGGVSVHLLDYTVIDIGKKEIDTAMNYFKECIITESWPKNYDYYSPNENGIFNITTSQNGSTN